MKIKVLDHGFVEFVEAWGNGREGQSVNILNDEVTNDFEVGIIEAARQSTQGAFRGWETDQKLLTHLYNNKHATPFEFAGLVLEVKAPIFVFREWHRHRTQSYNEMSARYAALPDECYIPDWEALAERGRALTKNKQAQGVVVFDESLASAWLDEVESQYARLEKLYRRGLEAGVPKELARITMPVGHYTQMRCHANLRNWLGFLTLRMDPLAQWEIRQYANAVGNVIAETFPRTWELYHQGIEATRHSQDIIALAWKIVAAAHAPRTNNDELYNLIDQVDELLK